jgi:hypothetical protein
LGILEDLAVKRGIKDLTKANGEVIFEVYKLALQKIHENLGKDTSRLYLEEVKTCLNTMENGFYSLIANDAVHDVDLYKILHIFLAASSMLEAALGEDDGSFDFINKKKLSRMKLFEFIQQLR